MAKTKWAHEQSDLPPDPAVHWGILPNGLRYAIRPNAEPKGRIAMRFVVLAGSLHEADDERGLAHFLEHMAFRRTKDHPEGTLIASLQRMGIAFGPDNTAFTNYDFTIYHLELPDSSEHTLREGLGVFREYADGLIFTREDVDLERGVVLSELSTRDKPDLRTYNANQAFMLPEARINERAPIGLEAQIRNFTPEQIQAFYDAWYRPERMVLTLVGEIDPAEGAKLIAELFDTLESRGQSRPEPSRSIANEKNNGTASTMLFKEQNITGVGLNLQHAITDPLEIDTKTKWNQNLNGSLAFHMLQRRFHKISTRRGASFISPSVNFGNGPQGWQISALSLHSSLRSWRLVIQDAEQELRRALNYGFTEAELKDAKIYYRTYYEQGVRSAATAPSDSLATGLANAIAYNHIFSSPELVSEIMMPMVEKATLVECWQEFRQAWGEETPKLFMVANSSLNVSEAELSKAYDYSRRIEILPPQERGEVVFGYTDFGPSGKLVANEYMPDLDVWLAKFDNGTRFNFKQTDFEDDTVLVSLRVGHGWLTQPEGLPGLNLLANYGFLTGGLGRHTNEEMTDVLNGHVISLNFAVDTDAFAFSMRCATRELLLGMQIITAILTDSAYRPEAVRLAHSGYGSLFETLQNSPGGTIFMIAPRLLASGDSRFGVPDMSTLTRRTLAELKSWMQPEFSHSQIEISVVGDIDQETATAALARTVGALPKRKVTVPPAKASEVAVPITPGAPLTWPVDPKLKQIAVSYYWPVVETPDVPTERRCGLLARVIEERLRQRVREELGAAYSVSARFSMNEGFPQQNFFEIYTEVKSSRANEVDQLIQREIAAMRREGITRDEFDRSKQPYLTQRSVDLRRNSYWGHTVLGDAQTKPERLISARNRTADNNAITQAEIQNLLDRYLDPAAAFIFRTAPFQNEDQRR
jgi:zinc protease|uniref:M16 family metallopeptidase n=1 Tax=Cephaloticoccus sp. TaxID=1985742 RepID=UPI00404B268B